MRFFIFMVNACLVVGILRLFVLLVSMDSKDDAWNLLETGTTVLIVLLIKHILNII